MPSQVRALADGIKLRIAGLWVIAIAALVTVWVEAQAANAPFDIGLGMGFAIAFLATRLLTVRLPQGDEVGVMLMVGVVGLALVDLPTLIAAALIAGLVEAAARFSRTSSGQCRSHVRDTIRNVVILALLSPWQLVLHPLVSAAQRSDLVVMLALAAGVVYAALDLFGAAIVHRASAGQAIRQSMRALMRSMSTVYVVHISMAAVVLRLQGAERIWPFPVAVLLTLILQNSFNLYIRIRRAYGETIGALAHAAELDRPHDSGHARRVADLSVTIGRRLGLSSRELERLGYAALLHDIGRMGAVGEDPDGRHALRGSELAASIPFLEGVAPLILWEPNGDKDVAPPIGWSIVRTCSHYDRLRSEVGAEAALTHLVEEARPLDRRVLEALQEVVRSKRIMNGVSA